MVSVSLKNVSKKWGSVVGVKETNLEIQSQEFIVFLGPSGCGKTTTMRMIAGLEQLSSGEILIDGRNVSHLEPKDRDIAMVFQSYGLYPNLSVYENIRFPLKVRKIDKSSHDARVRKAADRVELGPLLDRRPKELSGGQRQRVALARAIVREPHVFLMDEPLSNLDAKLRISTRAQLKNLQRELKATTIYVTHDQIEAMTLADRVVVMSKGEIQQVGTPEDIYDKPANTFVAGFIGTPSMNLIRGNLHNSSLSSDSFSIRNVHSDLSGDITFGIRAEDSFLASEEDAQLSAKVFSFELLGEATMITLDIGNSQYLAVRCNKNFRVNAGEIVHVAFKKDASHFFDTLSGDRL